MSVFFPVLLKIIPLYCNVLLGYLASSALQVDRSTIASLLVYIFGPVIVFNATMSVEISSAILVLPIFFYIFGSALGFIYARIFQSKWSDSTANILGFTAGTGNTGYYGIALAILIFDPYLADVFIFTVLASLFYESTTGFYITAKGTFSTKESLVKVARLPALYAFITALILNLSGVELPDAAFQYTGQFKTAFSILGMMLLGMGLQGVIRGGGADLYFIGHALFVKHILWPLFVLLFIFLDMYQFNLLNSDLYKVMFVFSIVPLAGNTVTLAILLKTQPEKATAAVFFSNFAAILYIPFMLLVYEILFDYLS